MNIQNQTIISCKLALAKVAVS